MAMTGAYPTTGEPSEGNSLIAVPSVPLSLDKKICVYPPVLTAELFGQ